MSQNPISIIEAEARGDYRLHLTFDDGKEQSVDFKPFNYCQSRQYAGSG
jgi:DUF971 family protein